MKYIIILSYYIYKKKCPRYIVSYFGINTCTHQSYEKMSKNLESIFLIAAYIRFSHQSNAGKKI